MKQNSIFIDNFYDRSIALEVKEVNTKKASTFITGIHPEAKNEEVRMQVVSEIFNGLLLHDKIVLQINRIFDLLYAFGTSDTLKLLNTQTIEFIDDAGLAIALGKNAQDRYSLSDLRMANGGMEWIEQRLSEGANKTEANLLLLNVERSSRQVDVELITKHIFEETQFDINNNHIAKYLELSSPTTENIRNIDTYNLLRLSNLNKTLIYSSTLGIENISMDAEIKPILEVKLSPRLNLSPSVNLYDSVFQNIFDKKKVPNLAALYLKKIISLEDYLSIVNGLGNKKFRQWILEKDYNPKELEKDIISSNTKLTNSITKFIKWTIPNAIGVFFPLSGVAASLTESFILDKLMSGWHPNLFIDDVLKHKIDSKVNSHAKEARANLVKEKFAHIGRNDKCPCGSEKKFKKCCGFGI